MTNKFRNMGSMKNRIIFTVLGGIVLFVWQFLAYAMPAFHSSSMEHTPLQDEILTAIEATGLEEGMYVLGQPAPEIWNDQEAMTAWQNEHEGGPHARINFEKSHSYSMGLNLLRGLLVCFLTAFLLHIILGALKDQSLGKRMIVSAVIGLMGFLFIPYTNFIWFKDPDIWAYFLDAVVPWVLLGALSAKFPS